MYFIGSHLISENCAGEIVELFIFVSCSDFVVHVCDTKPCKNGGECVPKGKAYTCKCTDAFQGKDCSQSKYYIFKLIIAFYVIIFIYFSQLYFIHIDIFALIFHSIKPNDYYQCWLISTSPNRSTP